MGVARPPSRCSSMRGPRSAARACVSIGEAARRRRDATASRSASGRGEIRVARRRGRARSAARRAARGGRRAARRGEVRGAAAEARRPDGRAPWRVSLAERARSSSARLRRHCKERRPGRHIAQSAMGGVASPGVADDVFSRARWRSKRRASVGARTSRRLTPRRTAVVCITRQSSRRQRAGRHDAGK